MSCSYRCILYEPDMAVWADRKIASLRTEGNDNASILGTHSGLCRDVPGSCLRGRSSLRGSVQSQEPQHAEDPGLWSQAGLGEPWCPGLLQDVPKETAPNADYPSWQAKNWMTASARIYCIGHLSCDADDEGSVHRLECWSPRFWYFTTLDTIVNCDWIFKNQFFCNFLFFK